MARRKPLTDEEGEVRELQTADFAAAKPFSSLPKSLQHKLSSLRGPQRLPTKKPVSIRLSPEVVEGFRATGDGWQTRIDEVLKKHLQKQRRSG